MTGDVLKNFAAFYIQSSIWSNNSLMIHAILGTVNDRNTIEMPMFI